MHDPGRSRDRQGRDPGAAHARGAPGARSDDGLARGCAIGAYAILVAGAEVGADAVIG
jgi:hypothetical protein